MIAIAASLEGNLTGSIYSDTRAETTSSTRGWSPCCGRRWAASSTTRCRPASR